MPFVPNMFGILVPQRIIKSYKYFSLIALFWKDHPTGIKTSDMTTDQFLLQQKKKHNPFVLTFKEINQQFMQNNIRPHGGAVVLFVKQ